MGGTRLREVTAEDLTLFYEHQLDRDATAMAAFESRDEAPFFAHWHKVLGDETVVARTIVYGDEVAGNVVSWLQDGHREIGYWIGRSHWGKGVATQALVSFLGVVGERPLHAWVARHNAGSIRVLEKAGFVFTREDGNHLVYELR
ncbi:MAG: GNAT family N-acetyltransferase [Actinomycetota bacterium]|nr:GNAT family N-acetyltransferase [Actinomycetota bacterium]